MAAIEHSKQVELQSPHLIVVRTLQAVWMLLKHQRRYRRSLSELSRFDSRLLRDIGLEHGEQAKRSEQEALYAELPGFFCRIAVSNCD
ncbi:DUF1127 domain-containing protein [Ensifer aridi]|uniref:DUF1127 domain-containing protein n=1 Tax=Ensifer aridi TaxID=1708715 RepID=UPI000614D609|nr:DUF1127 domain-containing protein [Ensifer aridi]